MNSPYTKHSQELLTVYRMMMVKARGKASCSSGLVLIQARRSSAGRRYKQRIERGRAPYGCWPPALRASRAARHW